MTVRNELQEVRLIPSYKGASNNGVRESKKIALV